MRTSLFLSGLLTLILAFNSCKKKFDVPPRAAEGNISSFITIDSIYQRYKVYYVTASVTPTQFYRFSGDVALECTVTADEVSGNLYKTVFVEDATGGLQINLKNSGGLYTGDKIRIHLNNLVLKQSGKVVQVDSVDVVKNVYKLSSGNIVTPKKISFNELNASMGFGSIFKYQSRLIMLDSVEFATGDKSQTYADGVNKASVDRNIVQTYGSGSVVMRSSGYSNFANSMTPCGSGSLVAILGQYNSTPQLTIRDINDVKLSSANCPLLLKSFNDNSVTSGGWSTYNVTGSINWTVASYNGQLYGNITNYISGTNYLCETWLISPAFDISGASNPHFSFQSAYNYTGPALQVLVSTNYVSGNPTSATLTALSPTLSSGGWNWAGSGNVSLSAYLSPNTRIAFKYTGTASSGSTWEIDDIAVSAQ